MGEPVGIGPAPLSLETMAVPSNEGAIPSLDGLRALSIVIVLLGHIDTQHFPGGHGVFLFFIISGFLITRLLFKERKATGATALGDFYMRRFFRLYPVILIYCAVIVTAYWIKDGRVEILEPLGALFYFANYLVPYRDITGVGMQMPFTVFWSLSVEEHFYLVFPLLFMVLRNPRSIALLAVAVCVAATAARLITAELRPDLVATHYINMRTEYRIDAIGYGVLLAALCELEAGRRLLRLFAHPVSFGLALLVGGVAVVVGGVYFANIVRYAILGPAIVVVMAGLIFSNRYAIFQRLLALPPLVWIGKLSYSLYVWHVPAALVAMAVFGGPVGVVMSVVLAIVAAAVSYYFIEQPMIRFGRRLRRQHFSRAVAAE